MEPRPPHAYQDFIKRNPQLAQAWELVGQAGAQGPLDEKSRRLIKLAVSLGALREGAVRANVRKALAMGISKDEIDQVIALGTGTIGFPGTVAVFTWIGEIYQKADLHAS
jgi:alkylhydroperoxidase/carboxymuconolactone decarboxylase family protein YurZ